MTHPGSVRLAAALLASLVLTLPAAAQAGDPRDPLATVDTIQLAPLNLGALAKEDADRALAGEPWRFAVPHDVYADPDVVGTWTARADGSALWQLRVQAPGALTLNLGFGEYRLPAGAALVVRAADGSAAIRPFTAADNAPHGELWTPVLPTDDLLVELSVPADRVDQVRLALTRIGQGYRGFGAGSGSDPSFLSGSCNVDVVCSEGDDWPIEIASVGAYSVNGFFTCSGALVNDTADSLTPWFLTADHCGISAGNQASVVVYWNYQNSVCRPPFSGASGGAGDGSLATFSSGVIFRADYSPSDFTLVEIEDPIDPAWNLGWSGWDRGAGDSASAVAIHHPGVEEKRISFEFQPTSTTSYLGDSAPGNGTHVRVEDWDIGTTEGGSSGSPLYSPEHRIIGQLHGGFASCTSQTPDWYGRVSVSWEGGGTPSTRLRDWLDPGNTGAMVTDSVSLDTLCAEAGTVAFLGGGSFACDGAAGLRVVDCGLDLDDLVVEQVQILVTSASEPAGELVMLTETSPGSARFEGAVQLGGVDAPGVLLVTPGELIVALYDDADTGGGSPATVQAVAGTDCTPALVSAVSLDAITAFSADVSVLASEAVTTTVHYGLACGALNQSATSTGNPSTNQTVTLDGLLDATTYRFSVEVEDAAGNVTVDDNGGACYAFTTDDAANYFTEQFVSDFDLVGTSLTFTPGGPDGYTVCRENIPVLPSPGSGTQLALDDDDSQQVSFGAGKQFSFYGQTYSSAWVGSNGYLTFGSPDSDYDETLGEHFELPRVAALYDDLNPEAGGSVRWQSYADRLVVTWDAVPEFNTSNSNTFQVELFYAPLNEVRVSLWLIASTDSIVGLSAGDGQQPDFLEQNLGASLECGDPAVCQDDLGFGGPGDLALSVCGDELAPGGSAVYRVENARAFGTVFHVLGLANNPTPFKGGLLVPVPFVTLASTSADGAGTSTVIVPGGLAGGALTVYAQAATPDPSQPAGFKLSNAVALEFLP